MNRKILWAAVIIVILVAGAALLQKENVGLKQEIKDLVFGVIEAKTGGQWDKKVEVTEIEESGNAAKGFYWAGDRWDWIVWRQDYEGYWEVLISLDGFDCEQLKQIPEQYNEFFRDIVYAPSGDLYCYNHEERE